MTYKVTESLRGPNPKVSDNKNSDPNMGKSFLLYTNTLVAHGITPSTIHVNMNAIYVQRKEQ